MGYPHGPTDSAVPPGSAPKEPQQVFPAAVAAGQSRRGDQTSVMAAPVIETALQVVRAYFARLSPLQRGLAERKTLGPVGAQHALGLRFRVIDDERRLRYIEGTLLPDEPGRVLSEIGRASCRERV